MIIAEELRRRSDVRMPRRVPCCAAARPPAEEAASAVHDIDIDCAPNGVAVVVTAVYHLATTKLGSYAHHGRSLHAAAICPSTGFGREF